MKQGWFIGGFEPSLIKTTAFEAAIKHYKASDYSKPHCHKIAKEITLIISGVVEMNGRQFLEGDMITIEPMEYADFLAISDAVTLVIKIPSVKNDKYYLEND